MFSGFYVCHCSRDCLEQLVMSDVIWSSPSGRPCNPYRKTSDNHYWAFDVNSYAWENIHWSKGIFQPLIFCPKRAFWSFPTLLSIQFLRLLRRFFALVKLTTFFASENFFARFSVACRWFYFLRGPVETKYVLPFSQQQSRRETEKRR